MVKVAFMMIVFQSDYVLEPCLASVLPFGQVYAAEGPVKFWQRQGFKTSTDKTNEILERYNIPTVHGQWAEKDDMSNAALALVPDDTDFVWVLDSDEIWLSEVLQLVFSTALELNGIDSVSFHATSFYGGFARYMTGFEENFEVHRIQRYYPGCRFSTHRPPTILAKDGKPWRNHRHILFGDGKFRFYHYSYVFPSQMYMKSAYYESMGGNIPAYFQRVYLPWILGNDTARQVIENEFDGVHNWLPERRGPCRTAPFGGQHPAEIEKRLPELRERLLFEMEAL